MTNDKTTLPPAASICYPDFLQTISMFSIVPAPGELYDEYEADQIWTNYGPDYSDPRVEFENTCCTVCRDAIGPMLGEDSETGHPTSAYRMMFDGPLGLVCEDCAQDLDPYPTTQAVTV